MVDMGENIKAPLTPSSCMLVRGREVTWRTYAEGFSGSLASTQSNLETKAEAPGFSIHADLSYIFSISTDSEPSILVIILEPRSVVTLGKGREY